MQKLTPLQQSTVIKFARQFAYQNASKQPKTGNDGVVHNDTQSSEKRMTVDAVGRGKGGTNGGHSQPSAAMPQAPQGASAPEMLVETCPICKPSFQTANLKPHMIRVWLLYDDAQLAQIQSLRWKRGCDEAGKKPGYENIPGFSFANAIRTHHGNASGNRVCDRRRLRAGFRS